MAEVLQPAQLQAEGWHKGTLTWDLPSGPAGKNKAGRAVGVATSLLGTDMSHRAGPGLGAAPTAPCTADSTVAMQLGEYWDCGRQRSKKGLLVAVSFPKSSWLWEHTAGCTGVRLLPSLLTGQLD